MATERVTVHTGGDGDDRNAVWLKLDGGHLLGRLQRESHAQKLAGRLNAALDKAAEDARADEREQCAAFVAGMAPEITQAKWIADQIRKEPA